MVRVLVLLALGSAVLLAARSGSAAAGSPGSPTALLVGDSVGTGMSWHGDAIAVMQKNLNIDWQVAICRRLIGESCDPGDGEPVPPTLVDLISSMSSVPATVVVEMGYNDFESTFAEAVDDTMQALLAKGAQHVLWLTLREARDPYPALNAILAQKAAQYPQLELLDWNALSVNRPGWFQNDFVHLVDAGGVAMAHLIHGAVIALYTPLHTAGAVPSPRAGRRYAAELRATGGTPPYRWRVTSGRPPRGLHLLANGRLYGHVAAGARMSFGVSVTDADGMIASEELGDETR